MIRRLAENNPLFATAGLAFSSLQKHPSGDHAIRRLAESVILRDRTELALEGWKQKNPYATRKAEGLFTC